MTRRRLRRISKLHIPYGSWWNGNGDKAQIGKVCALPMLSVCAQVQRAYWEFSPSHLSIIVSYQQLRFRFVSAVLQVFQLISVLKSSKVLPCETSSCILVPKSYGFFGVAAISDLYFPAPVFCFLRFIEFQDFHPKVGSVFLIQLRCGILYCLEVNQWKYVIRIFSYLRNGRRGIFLSTCVIEK